MDTFDGKVVVVTGAASGIGRALALNLASKGAYLALADRDGDGLQKTVEMIGPSDRKVTMRSLDVSDRAAVYHFAQETLDERQGVDALFNNAGVSHVASVELLDYEYFERIMNINFWGMVYGCKAFLPALKTRSQAHIVNVSSVDAFTGPPHRAAYASAKAAIAGFSESLQSELEDSSVTVSCVFPGLVKTNIARLSLDEGREYITRSLRETAGMTDEAIEETLKQIEAAVVAFDAADGTSAEAAAEIILEGVLQGKRRILVGKDAEWLDQLVRTDPEGYLKTLNPLRKAMFEKSKSAD